MTDEARQTPIEERAFTLLPEEHRTSKVRAAEVIAAAVKAHGEGIATIVRALNLWSDYLELRRRQREGETDFTANEQLILDAGTMPAERTRTAAANGKAKRPRPAGARR